MTADSPIRLEGELTLPLNRWLWLVKWFLLIPHIVCLIFLGIAFFFVTIAAFFVLLFTGRYPRGLFGFNVGVLRWGWRVAFYSYSALGTDQYPPFTLAVVPDYPARIEIDYPEEHRRGLPLIGWWLLGIPQYALAAMFAGGSAAFVEGYRFSGGVIEVLVLVAALVLLFKDRYPDGVFDVVMGFNRWAVRTLAFGALMRPEYPPFRFDAGPREPAAHALDAPGY
jgi:hypothetical protein